MSEYSIFFRQSALQDLEDVRQNIRNFSKSEAEAKYVLRLIHKGVQDLKNPYFLGLAAKSQPIAERGFYYYPIVGGLYVVYFKADKIKRVKTVYYIKSAKTDYGRLII